MSVRKIAPTLALLCFSVSALFAATPERPAERAMGDVRQDQVWTAAGGELKLRFNEDFLDLFGIGVEGAAPTIGQLPEYSEFAVYRIVGSDGLHLNAPEGGFDRFVGGLMRVKGGFALELPGGEAVTFKDMQLRASRHNGAELELVGDDGQAWLYINHLMYKMVDDYASFYVRSADVRATVALAERIGAPALADAYIGEMKMLAHVVSRPADFAPPTMQSVLACPNFHGDVHDTAGTYEADVLMENYDIRFTRCRRGDSGANGCDGTGPDDGEVVFTPNSTLRNSNNDNTADVPWYRKFTVSPYNFPYPGNDQHPYLIWNLYRITDGQLEQIGASGVKHAFLTINSQCAPGACTGGGHILGRNCGDTYGTANNDSNTDLGPRNELIPATGVWGRCGSIYDVNCDGSSNSPGNTSYDQRLVVRESQLLAPGSQFYSESWYLVQDDIDIYNTMAHRSMAPVPDQNIWIPGSQGAFRLGPLINTWVDPVLNPTRNVEIANDEGHVRIAVNTKALASCPAGSGLSGNCWRYDYAVHNFDFARAKTEGALPNLRVLSNLGFGGLSIPVGAASVHVDPDNHFADIDIDANNNWDVVVDDGAVTWTAPEGNELNWGLLFRFSLVSNVEPDPMVTTGVTLTVADADNPEALTATMMAPFEAQTGNDIIFAHDFETSGSDNGPRP